MVLDTSIVLGSAKGGHDNPVQTTRPAQFAAAWKTAAVAGIINVQDASTITDPDAEITGATNKTFFSIVGTLLRVRVMYDDGVSSITNPIIKLFGRLNDGDKWQIMQNMDEQIRTTITLDTTNDISNGTVNWTLADLNAHTFDKDGCEEFLLGVEVALAATGTVTTATVEFKEL